ncbi:uncharacterized protein LOC129721530 [Wyeomyia smithii]|uniref:uncharacterized protein LOC129721530 n=1 Tax=Wyeomyia smithii TaxID=174621 RepID=UPI002467F5AB|nr:uncharacterized protein LOC129721530 [Wyeomyia smithii]
MDAYIKLDWSKNHRRSEPRLLDYFAIDFSRYTEDIFNLHINEVDIVHQPDDLYVDNHNQTEVDFPIDPRNGTEVRKIVIDNTSSGNCLSTRLYEQFPSGSRLNRAEHQHCLTVLNRLNMRLPFETVEELEALAKYRSLITKLEKERSLFDSFVKSFFNNDLVFRKRTVDSELNNLVVHIWKHKVQRTMETVTADKTFHLSTAVMWLKYKNNEQKITFEPVSEHNSEIESVKHIFTENLLSCRTLKRNVRVIDRFLQEQLTLSKTDDSAQVELILKQVEDVRFVINSGTLTHMLDIFSNIQNQWFVPFKIISVEGRNVIYIDKKMQPIRMMSHNRNVKAHKYLIRSFMSHLKKDGSLGTGRKTRDQKTPQTSDYKVFEFDDYLQRLEEMRKTSDTPQQNVSLSLWKLQNGDEQYRFLVRFRMDCYESLRKVKFFINVSVKLEYQAEFGAEQMTQSELIREWTRQFLRPNSKTLRLRINAVTHTILSHHYLELKDIEEELKRTYDIEPMNLITNLWQTLKLLLSFPPGDHLMQHDTKNPETVLILSNDPNLAGSGISLNFSNIYSSVEYEPCVLEQYDWVPIDRTVITKLHKEHTLLPCTFPHWNNVQRIVAREKLRPKPKPVQVQAKCQLKAKKSKGNRERRKRKERERKQQKRKEQTFVTKIQNSLDQFAPYPGPLRFINKSSSSCSSSIVESPMKNSAKGETIDYQTYIDQANVQMLEK